VLFDPGSIGQATLGAPDAEAGFFGEPVVIDGDVAVVGAVNTSPSAGAAYAFRRAAGVWSAAGAMDAEAFPMMGPV
jgi:hypothetical protein